MLNCDFKSYRCKSYYLPILKKFLEKKIVIPNIIIVFNENNIDIDIANYLYNFIFFFKNSRLNFKKKNKFLLTNHLIRSSVWFTKNTNLEKLFVVGFKLFLSPGIVLNFLNTPYKFLRRKQKTWFGFITAYLRLNINLSLLYFTNLFGFKKSLLEKLFRLKRKNFLIFIKLFYLNFIFIKKTKKRIKRWVTKKFYRYINS